MKSKYLIVAVLALGLSSAVGAVGCNKDEECQRVNCEMRLAGVDIHLTKNGNPYDAQNVKVNPPAVCKKVGGEAAGVIGHCTCNLTVEIP
ncbi:MAG: hypothetical protein NTZ86_02730 [Legionellales bacterium]|nr:hypothetical protein [Legionellales bacterium]